MSPNTGLPAPFVVPNSGRWLGSDGSWSTFYIHVGTPAQYFHVLPNFNGQTIYVPIDEDCQRLNTTDCGKQRGVEVFKSLESAGFQRNASSTWKELGIYKMGLGEKLGNTGNARFGYDTFGPASSRSTDTINLENLPVAAYATPNVWVGQLGLSTSALNISDTEQPHSLLSRIKEEGHIPSLSFGYQAGAPYHLIVGLQDVSVQFNNGTAASLSTNGILATIDTNAPEMWLPRSLCDVFASTLGLTYFAGADRYILADSVRIELQRTNPTFNFRIGTAASGGETITIGIPYAAFDLQANYPVFGTQTNYFPLRRAANESQYTLGRAFLQEIYLSVDWERGVFNLSQAAFNSPPLPVDIVTIEPGNRSANLIPRPDRSAGLIKLSTGAIVGIAIGAFLCIFLITAVVWFYYRKKQRKAFTEASQDLPMEEKRDTEYYAPEAVIDKSAVAAQSTNFELEGRLISEMYAPHEGSAMRRAFKPHGVVTGMCEADASSPIYEMPGPDQNVSSAKWLR